MTTNVATDTQEAFDMRIDYFMDEVDGLVRRIIKRENLGNFGWRIDPTFIEVQKATSSGNYKTEPVHALYVACYNRIRENNLDEALEIHESIMKCQ